MVDIHFWGVKQFAEQGQSNLLAAHNVILENHMLQTFHANKKRREDPIHQQDDFVYLSTKNLTLPKGRAQKLVTKFIRPYKVLKLIIKLPH